MVTQQIHRVFIPCAYLTLSDKNFTIHIQMTTVSNYSSYHNNFQAQHGWTCYTITMFPQQPVCRRAALSNICQHTNHMVLSGTTKAKDTW
jgi:hypothetical protein